jgi:hypothetical protein
VVFRRAKFTSHPGRRAQGIRPAVNGDDYSYVVEKFWIVSRVLADGKLELQTRRGKTHVIEGDDPNLRHATLWDRLRHRSHFSQLRLEAGEA